MNSHDLIILIPTTAICLLLLWLEWRRPNRYYLYLRMAAILVACISIVWLGIYSSGEIKMDTTGILITDGAKDTAVPENKKYSYERYLASGDTTIKKWVIDGYGLSEEQLSYLQPVISAYGYTLPGAGIRSASWQQQLVPGKPLLVQGHCFNQTGTALALLLEGYGATQDSIGIPAGKEVDFHLQAPIKHAGRAIFYLRLTDGKRMIENNPVPFIVTRPEPIRLLVLASSPDFEYRFLQRWLGENGFSAVVRTRISRDQYQQSFINRNTLPVLKLTASLLDSFDVVLTDGAALEQMPGNEKKLLRQEVENEGLGLMIRADTVLTGGAFYASGIRFQTIVPDQTQRLRPVFTTVTDSLAALPVNQLLAIQPNRQLQSLISDKDDHLLAASLLAGAGRVTVTTIPNTFQWQLAGATGSYASYWTRMLEQLARKKTKTGYPALPPGIFRKADRIPLNWIGDESSDSVMLVVNDSIRVLTGRDPRVPYLWRGDYWPVQGGWQTISDGVMSTSMYIYQQQDWPMVQAFQRIAATSEWYQRSLSPDKPQPGGSRPFNRGWLVCLFLLSVSFLWFERKFLA